MPELIFTQHTGCQNSRFQVLTTATMCNFLNRHPDEPGRNSKVDWVMFISFALRRLLFSKMIFFQPPNMNRYTTNWQLIRFLPSGSEFSISSAHYRHHVQFKKSRPGRTKKELKSGLWSYMFVVV